MAEFLWVNSGALAQAAAERTRLNSLHKLILYSNPVSPSPSVQLSTLTECDFSGYVQKSVALGAPYLDPLRGGASCQQYAQWDFDGAADPPVSNLVYGFALIATPGGGDPDYLVQLGTFDAPVSMSGGGQSIPLTVVENFGSPPA